MEASERKSKKEKKKKDKKKRKHKSRHKEDADDRTSLTKRPRQNEDNHSDRLFQLTAPATNTLAFEHRYIMAPMVGASELPFRLLCRQYGTQLCYTPMLSAARMATDVEYRTSAFLPSNNNNNNKALDRPLVCHMAANTPHDLAAAAIAVAPYCDAIDLNLGCPQRTAFVGHFGSYLLGPQDRSLICSMVRSATQAGTGLPILVKIRLLDTLEETVTLCEQLADAGASLIAIHARYRASWERKGPGARDGPALLHQVAHIRQHLARKHVAIVTNGNTITYIDVEQNLQFTGADGLMSAEGLLDNPALFLPRWGSPPEDDDGDMAALSLSRRIPWTLPIPPYRYMENRPNTDTAVSSATTLHSNNAQESKQLRKVQKKLRKIARLETLRHQERDGDGATLTAEEEALCAKKAALLAQKAALEADASSDNSKTPTSTTIPKDMSLSDLHKSADEKLPLAYEYLALVDLYPTALRTVVFHIRRMCKDLLVRYQLLETCIQATTVSDVRTVLDKIAQYQRYPTLFVYDKEKAAAEKEALERKRHQEGQRKAFEARMRRKAKREGRFDDLDYYLHQGAAVPKAAFIHKLRQISDKVQVMALWKAKHGQHCLAFHLEGNCARERACAFLHVDSTSANAFDEQDEVAG